MVRYEELKDHIRQHHIELQNKYHFFQPFHTELTLREHLEELYGTYEPRLTRRQRKKNKKKK